MGQVIMAVFDKRDAHWERPVHSVQDKKPKWEKPMNTRTFDQATAEDPPAKRQKTKADGKGQRNKPVANADTWKSSNGTYQLAGRTVQNIMKDGTQLCRGFQKGDCKAENCKKGLHKCGVVIKNTRVCGYEHAAINHTDA